jgi:hypothetical protein
MSKDKDLTCDTSQPEVIELHERSVETLAGLIKRERAFCDVKKKEHECEVKNLKHQLKYRDNNVIVAQLDTIKSKDKKIESQQKEIADLQDKLAFINYELDTFDRCEIIPEKGYVRTCFERLKEWSHGYRPTD